MKKLFLLILLSTSCAYHPPMEPSIPRATITLKVQRVTTFVPLVAQIELHDITKGESAYFTTSADGYFIIQMQVGEEVIITILQPPCQSAEMHFIMPANGWNTTANMGCL